MKANILSFLLGVFVILSISSTTFDIKQYQPKHPKYIVVQNFEGANISNDIKIFIIKYSKQGYITKSVSLTGTSYGYGIVIMEKY